MVRHNGSANVYRPTLCANVYRPTLFKFYVDRLGNLRSSLKLGFFLDRRTVGVPCTECGRCSVRVIEGRSRLEYRK